MVGDNGCRAVALHPHGGRTELSRGGICKEMDRLLHHLQLFVVQSPGASAQIKGADPLHKWLMRRCIGTRALCPSLFDAEPRHYGHNFSRSGEMTPIARFSSCLGLINTALCWGQGFRTAVLPGVRRAGPANLSVYHPSSPDGISSFFAPRHRSHPGLDVDSPSIRRLLPSGHPEPILIQWQLLKSITMLYVVLLAFLPAIRICYPPVTDPCTGCWTGWRASSPPNQRHERLRPWCRQRRRNSGEEAL
jgi:hypothetical protein